MPSSLGAVLLFLSLLTADVAKCQDDLGHYYYSPDAEYDNCQTCPDDGDLTVGEDLLCRCDSNCTLYGDCCKSRIHLSDSTDAGPLDGLLECRSIYLDERTQPDWEESFWMVSACPAEWAAMGDDQLMLDILINCSRGSDNLPPVTVLQTGLVYKNEYCAACHRAQNIRRWGYTFVCNPTELRQLLASQTNLQLTLDLVQRWCLACRFRDPHQTNRTFPEARPCVHTPLVMSSCLERNDLQVLTKVHISEQLYQEIASQCKGGPISPVVSEWFPRPFRNQYCVLCNGIRVNNKTLKCVSPYQHTYRDNTNPCQIEAAATGGSSISGTLNNSLLCDDFLIGPLDNSEHILLIKEFGGEVIDIISYSNDSALICTNLSQNETVEMNVTFPSYSYPLGLTILTYVGFSLSVIGCAFVLLTYSLFKELRTLPGKILMNLCAAILANALFLLIRIPLFYTLATNVEFCVTTAIFLHWLVLSQFSWMAVMSCELARTMIRASRMRQTETGAVKRNVFLIYLLIGWGIPTLMIGLSSVLNYTTEYIQYGQGSFCLIGDSMSFYTVFLAPIALSLILNGAAFFVTSYLLVKAQRGEARLQKERTTSYLRIHLSVFSITGLTWVFGFVAILTKDQWAWYVFIILTYTQGFTICAAFLFTQKIFSLYKERFWSKVSRKLSLKNTLKRRTQSTLLAVIGGKNTSTESAPSVENTQTGSPINSARTQGQSKQEPVSYPRNFKKQDVECGKERDNITEQAMQRS